MFWVLDGFYISQERHYRDLYKEVAAKSESEINFSMDASIYSKGDRIWLAGIFSKTLIPFYGISIATTLTLMFLIK
jgi:hypothetical protein